MSEATVISPTLRVARTGVNGDVVTRDDVERAIWTMTGWQGGQEMVDELLTIIDGYAIGHCGGELDPRTVTEVAVEPARVELPSEGSAAPLVPLEPLDETALDHASQTMGETKRCLKCHVVKSIEDFGIDRSNSSGRKPRCKPCLREDQKAYAKARRDRAAG